MPVLKTIMLITSLTLICACSVKAQEQQTEQIVILETNQGLIKIKLYPSVAPKTCENFVGLIKKGYYNGLIFHRVIPNFMIQGGDPTGTGMGGESLWGGKFADEFSPDVKFTKPGLLAMANSGPATNGSQFFITAVPTPHLNNRHTIFGEVLEGMDVVEKIINTPRDRGDRPMEEQKIIKAYLPENK
jgi:peptidylprolyl isomerase